MKIRTFLSLPEGVFNRLENITDNVKVELVNPRSLNEFVLIVSTIKNNTLYKQSVKLGKTITFETMHTYIKSLVDKVYWLCCQGDLKATPTNTVQNNSISNQTVSKIPFCERIVSHRILLGLSRQEYADRVQCSLQTLTRLENIPGYEEHVRDKSIISRIKKYIEGKSF